ncbi:Retinol dehydrogenase 14 [Aphelenchoides bicaudatus]|nr:Retinol dehydrogenase 14 [Aphelenchoides bicaudatus]
MLVEQPAIYSKHLDYEMKTNGVVNGQVYAPTQTASYKRTILVTGATDGLGKQLALELASKVRENFVIIHGRTQRNCEKTLQEIAVEQKVLAPTNVAFIVADFGDFEQVMRMADEIKQRYKSLNIVISCAATLAKRKLQSKNGLELQFQVNHMANFALLNLLLPLLEKNVPSRILTVGSMLHSLNPIDWDDINCEKTYDKFRQYSRTNLMNHLMTFCLHRLFFKHHLEFRVTANVVDADQRTDRQVYKSHVNGTMQDLSASESHLCTHSGAVNTLVRLAESPEYASISGKYYNAIGKEIDSSSEVRDVRLQNRLWLMSADYCRRLGVEPAENGVVV